MIIINSEWKTLHAFRDSDKVVLAVLVAFDAEDEGEVAGTRAAFLGVVPESLMWDDPEDEFGDRAHNFVVDRGDRLKTRDAEYWFPGLKSAEEIAPGNKKRVVPFRTVEGSKS